MLTSAEAQEGEDGFARPATLRASLPQTTIPATATPALAGNPGESRGFPPENRVHLLFPYDLASGSVAKFPPRFFLGPSQCPNLVTGLQKNAYSVVS
jgi:hypothetical protein